MGNFNDDIADDWMIPDGNNSFAIAYRPENAGYAEPNNRPMWDATMNYGEAWAVKECPPSPEPPANVGCTPEEKNFFAQSPDYCGKLALEPFAECTANSVNVALDFKRESCVFDLCIVPVDKRVEVLCSYLDQVEVSCLAEGYEIAEWRRADFCPRQCDSNMVWNHQASSVPLTIRNCQDSNTGSLILNAKTIPACSCPSNLPIWDDVQRKCVSNCPAEPCDLVNCGPNGVCEKDSGLCICDPCSYGSSCQITDLCCFNNVNCGPYGTCDSSTARIITRGN